MRPWILHAAWRSTLDRGASGPVGPTFFGSRAQRRAASGIEKAGAYDVYGMCLDGPFFIETTELFIHILEVV